MSDQLREALSAVMDGEADEFELRRVLDEVGRDSDLSEQWHRYELIGAALRGDPLAPASLGSGLRAALAGDEVDALLSDEHALAEQAQAAPELALAVGASQSVSSATGVGATESKRSRFGPLIGVGVAAAVAFAVVVGVDPAGSPSGAQPEIAQQLSLPVEGEALAVADTEQVDTQRARAYLMHHVQQTAMNRGRVVSFARLASVDSATPEAQPAVAPQTEN